MTKTKIMRVSEEFNDYLNLQMEEMIRSLEMLGISRRKISKVKATKLLVQKIYENGNKIRIL